MGMTHKSAKEGPRIVMHDAHIGLSALFRPLSTKGPLPKLDVTYEPASGGVVLKFSGKDALGIPEQTLLLVLLELAQEHRHHGGGAILAADTEAHIARQLWDALYSTSKGKLPATLHFSTTWHELARRIGCEPGGTRQRLLQAQLRRLCECVVWERYPDSTEFQSYLVAMVRGDDKRVHIALNVRLADAISGGRYMPVSLTERLQLETAVARALHAHLSVWLRAGERQRVGIDTLAERLWPRKNSLTGNARCAMPDGTVRRHRSEVRSALREIGQLEQWRIQDIDAKVATVFRGPDVDVKNHSDGSAVREKTDAREKTRQLANVSMSRTERPSAGKVNCDLGFGTIDASALFISK